MPDKLNLDEIEARARAALRAAEDARRSGWFGGDAVPRDVLALLAALAALKGAVAQRDAEVARLEAEKNKLRAELDECRNPRRKPYPNHPGYRSTGNGSAPYFGGSE